MTVSAAPHKLGSRCPSQGALAHFYRRGPQDEAVPMKQRIREGVSLEAC